VPLLEELVVIGEEELADEEREELPFSELEEDEDEEDFTDEEKELFGIMAQPLKRSGKAKNKRRLGRFFIRSLL